MKLLEELAARRRFGMKPGLDTIRMVSAALGDPHRRLRNVIHVAGTNGKGAVCAILDAALSRIATVARYTSPHLVRLNERFFLGGAPVADEVLDRAAARLGDVISSAAPETAASFSELTFFEALTAVAFEVFAEADPDYTVLETGLGGRLDATNVCEPRITVITKIGLDHCDWLGDTLEKIAAEKSGIIKPGVPVVLARNCETVRRTVENRAREVGAPYFYAPELATEAEIPAGFSLAGGFNRENAVTALAVLRVLLGERTPAYSAALAGFPEVVWPGRFQRIGDFIVDGAHNPPAAAALAAALREGAVPRYDLVAGFCGDKDVDEVLRILAPYVRKGYAVRTCNPRSLAPEIVAARMRKAGIDAVPLDSLQSALAGLGTDPAAGRPVPVLICGSLFLAGEAIVRLGAYPWGQSPESGIDPSELLRA